MLNIEHPDLLANQAAIKAIARGSMQALEYKAIAEYIRVYDEQGREAAEETFFKHFNKGYGVDKHTRTATGERGASSYI